MAAGENFTILKPNIWVAPYSTDTDIPALSSPYGFDHSAKGWSKVTNTGQGAVITTAAPMEEIETEENGVIGMVPGAGDSITIAYQLKTPTLAQLATLSQMTVTSVAAQTTPTAYPAFKELRLKPGDSSNYFMIMLEGQIEDNALVANGGLVRAFGWRVIQTGNGELAMRHKGAEGVVQPSAELRCSIAVLDAAQLTGSGLVAANLDPRFNMYVIENLT